MILTKRKLSEVKEKKRCSRCRKLKPRASTCFAKNKRSPDGFCPSCKACQKKYRCGAELDYGYRDLHKGKMCESQREPPERSKVSIDSWSQVDSVVREMAEVQAAINTEQATHERQIAQLKEYVKKPASAWQARQEQLTDTLREFFKKNCTDTMATTQEYRFGTVGYFGGHVILDLNTELAKERIGKP